MKATATPEYSLIIPTFRRADEVSECLDSLSKQSFKNFEVIIADGTPEGSLEPVAEPYKAALSLHFLYEAGIGVSEARNLGFEKAIGKYIIFLDSDCIIPPNYLKAVHEGIQEDAWDLFGGPDAASASFTPVQKAISYSMTSLLTTGGIRGQKKHVGQYHPRSFNMGMRREIFEAVNGFSDFKCGEDIELSIRIIKAGYKVGLIEEAYVYHKRRTNFKQFFRQVFRFGAARINIGYRHPGSIKLPHLFPLVFTSGLLISLILLFLLPVLGKLALAGYLLYALLLVLHSTFQNKSIQVGVLSLYATLVQFTAYAYGFLANARAVYLQGNPKGIEL